MANLIKLPASGWVCGSLQWLLTSFEACSSWAYVWLSLDRYLAIMKPNWYRVNGGEDRAKRPLFIFTVLVFILASPLLFLYHKKIMDWHCLEEDLNNAYVCYWSDAELAPYLDLYGFLFGISLYSVCPVTLVVVLNSISAVAFLRRYFAKKKKLQSQGNVSGRHKTAGEAQENKDTRTSTTAAAAAAKNDRKLSGVMLLLSLSFVMFVGSWYCLKYGLQFYSFSQFYASGAVPDWYWYKVFEVVVLLGQLTTSFNGIVNSLILLMSPVTRQSLKTFLRRLFGKATE